MSGHPSDGQLNDLVDGQLQGEDLNVVQSHVQSCSHCQSAVASTRTLLHALRSLPIQAENLATSSFQTPPPATFFPSRRVALAAAALAIFAAGLSFGLLVGQRSPTPVQLPSDSAQEAAAERIQHAGTDYVSAIAQWRRNRASAAEGREVAIATLYGAVHELQKLQPEDPRVAIVVQSLGTLRNEVISGKGSGTEGQR